MEISRRCPLTRGQETSMTAPAFQRLCRRQQGEAQAIADDGRYVSSRGNFVLYSSICLSCDGQPPPELTIITIPPPPFCDKGEADVCRQRQA